MVPENSPSDKDAVGIKEKSARQKQTRQWLDDRRTALTGTGDPCRLQPRTLGALDYF